MEKMTFFNNLVNLFVFIIHLLKKEIVNKKAYKLQLFINKFIDIFLFGMRFSRRKNMYCNLLLLITQPFLAKPFLFFILNLPLSFIL